MLGSKIVNETGFEKVQVMLDRVGWNGANY
jgi:hypothetical protein